MAEDKYTVILEFNPQHFDIVTKIKFCLTRLKRTDPAHLEKLLSSGKIVIKRHMDLETAKLVSNLFRDTGGTCFIEKQTSIETGFKHGEEQFDHEGRPIYMVCPKCGKMQPFSQECWSCGVIIAKVKNREALEDSHKGTNSFEDDSSYTEDTVLEQQDFSGPKVSTFWKWLWMPFKFVDIRRWPQRTRSALYRCGLNFIAASLLEIGLLWSCKYLWSIYKLTPIGQLYVANLANDAEMLDRVFKLDPVEIGWKVTLLILIVLLIFGFVAQFLRLIRYLYESRGIFGKLLLWFVPAIAGTAWLLTQHESQPSYETACVFVTIPTLCLLPSCFYLARVVMPEIGGIGRVVNLSFHWIIRLGRKLLNRFGIQWEHKYKMDSESAESDETIDE